MKITGPNHRTVKSLVTVAALLVSASIGVAWQPAAAQAATSPVVDRPSGVVTADALPTVQIDGIVWAQAVAGNTVYAGGRFTTARPAGAAAGVNTTPRNNLLAYDITTGNLVTSFVPNLNAQVKAVAVSPDGTRVYVGGQFTTANGANRYRVAAYSTSTGALITSFAPSIISTVNALAVTNTTVYVGGAFTQANGATRNRLAAFQASNGALTGWDPNVDGAVNALTMSPDGSRVFVGGSFQNIGGAPAYGLAALDAGNGALVPWAVTNSVRNAGQNAAILSLSTDGTSIFGTGYVYGAGGNLEGAFSADPTTGAMNWVEDCHGDTYGVFSSGAAVYTVSHAHYCGNIGGFPQTDPKWTFHRAMAFTPDATGTVDHDTKGYYDWYGNPSPSIMNWWPDLDVGTVSGATQAAWSVTGNSKYVVLGGEFPKVNGTAQQGLVRFATSDIAPDKQGPRVGGADDFNPTMTSLAAGTVRVTWPSNWDRDDTSLTYNVIRNGASGSPAYTTTAKSTFWNRPTLGFTDTGLTPGSTVTYRVTAKDATGNSATSQTVSYVVPLTSPGTTNAYQQSVLADAPQHYWRLDEGSGLKSYDWAGFDDLSLNSGVALGAGGAVLGDADQAAGFDGSNAGFGVDPTPVKGPNTFSEEAWFKTTSTTGGKIVSFGDQATGNSGNYDRHIYMDPSGHVYFGVYNNASYTVNTPSALNDGQWHQVVGTMSANGIVLYVDGKKIGANTGTSAAQPYTGYWRVGGDTPWTGNGYFNGTIDDVAIYGTPLSLTQVRNHYAASGRGTATPPAPTDNYGKTIYQAHPDFYYRMDDTSGPTAVDSSENTANGTYSGQEAFGAAGPVSGNGGKAVTFSGTPGSTLASPLVGNPTTYSEELWFNTTTTNGGKLIGFGNSPTGNSGSYDRHVYMDPDGRLNFGTYTGQLNLATSSTNGYNDGKWHYLVATQGSDGMKLYVDGAVVGTNPQTGAEGHDGYWRIGGDTAWNNTAWFAGTIDEAAIYSGVLTPDAVTAHYKASALGNAMPTAAFTSSSVGLKAAFDGSGSVDPDGTVASYSWDFGDATAAGTGVSPTHKYTAAGTYPVTLTVTDDAGATNVVTHPITVAVVPPSASFQSSVTGLRADFDGSASADTDGTIASYSWNFGDGTAAGTGATPSHTYTAGDTYTVTLTVTDNDGATDSTVHTVSVTRPNATPTAAFTSSSTALVATFDGRGSSDSDGTIATYAWNFGDSGTDTGATPSHTYAAAGTYNVVLTVTDNDGATNSVSKPVTVARANVAPTAAFTATTSDLTATVDGSGSTDPDGTVASYSWTFGDSTAAVTGAKPSHVYTTAGTYTVTLTVTDNSGATASTSKPVTVTAPTTLARDTFTRTTTSGLGTATSGGDWTLSGSASAFKVDGSAGHLALTAKGAVVGGYLNSVSAANVDFVVDTSMDKVETGSGSTVQLLARHVGKTDYRLKVRYLVNGVVHLVVSKVVNGTETTIKEVNVPAITYTAGAVLRMRMTVKGANPTTVTGKIWAAAGTEPAANQVSVTDSEATLQGAGSVGVMANLSSTSTSAPVDVKLDNLVVAPF